MKYAGAGNDYVIGAAGSDEIYGGDGDDIVYAEGGDNTILGGEGDDFLSGVVGLNSSNGGSNDIDGDDEDDLDGGATLESLTFLSCLYKNNPLNIANCTFCQKDGELTKQIFECADGDIHNFGTQAADSYGTTTTMRLAA